MLNVDSHIEPVVVPVRVVIATPLPVGFEFVNVSIHLPAMLAMFRRIVVDPSPVGLQAPMAILCIIPVAKCGLPSGSVNAIASAEPRTSCAIFRVMSSSPKLGWDASCAGTVLHAKIVELSAAVRHQGIPVASGAACCRPRNASLRRPPIESIPLEAPAATIISSRLRNP